MISWHDSETLHDSKEQGAWTFSRATSWTPTDYYCFLQTKLNLIISESIVTTIRIKSGMFEKFKSIQWFDINNRQKKAILQQFKKQRISRNKEFQVHFYENGITFKTHYGSETKPIRTSPFPILNLYWSNKDDLIVKMFICLWYDCRVCHVGLNWNSVPDVFYILAMVGFKLYSYGF